MIQSLLDELNASWPLGEPIQDGLCSFKASGMRFSVTACEAAGLGHVSVMTAGGMAGLMKMETLIVNPFYLDAPLFSYDRIHAMGREVLVAEMYDTMLGGSFRSDELQDLAEKYAGLPDGEPKSYWYDDLIVPPSISKKGAKKDAARFDALARDIFRAYLRALKAAAPCDPAAKKQKAAVYSEGLLTHGGPATDPVKKAIGEEKAARLFRELLFGAP